MMMMNFTQLLELMSRMISVSGLRKLVLKFFSQTIFTSDNLDFRTALLFEQESANLFAEDIIFAEQIIQCLQVVAT